MAITPLFLAQNSKVGRVLKTRDHEVFKNSLTFEICQKEKHLNSSLKEYFQTFLANIFLL